MTRPVSWLSGTNTSCSSSDELQADLLRKSKPKQDFVAISRFGIGVLSSFIIGDRIEVSTRRRRPDGRLANPLRLSLDSLDDFFVLQEYSKHKANPMPGRHGQEDGYRKRAGTSVAVRIDPTKSDVAMAELLERAKNYLHFPPVPVFINDIEQKDRALARLDKPLMDAPIRRRLTPSDSTSNDPVDLLATSELSIVAIPLNLTTSSPSPALRGQLIGLMLDASRPINLVNALPIDIREQLPESPDALDRDIIYHGATLSLRDSRTISIELSLECLYPGLSWIARTSRSRVLGIGTMGGIGTLEGSAHFHQTWEIGLDNFVDDADLNILDRHWLGHNGITVSTSLEPAAASDPTKTLKMQNSRNILILGPVCLFDNLRPEVSVSRDTLRDVPFHVRSALQLAVRRAAAIQTNTPERPTAEEIRTLNLLPGLSAGEVTLAHIESDPLISRWKTERIIEPPKGERLSIEEVRQLAEHQSVLFEVSSHGLDPHFDGPRFYGLDPHFDGPRFYETLRLAMVELELDTKISNFIDTKISDFSSELTRSGDVTVYSANRPVRPAGLCALHPFTVVRYDPADVLIRPGYPANLCHPIASWFAEHAAALKAGYPAFFVQFMRAFTMIGGYRRDIEGANDAAELLNATLDRIRRSWPDPPRELFTEVYADTKGQLRMRS